MDLWEVNSCGLVVILMSKNPKNTTKSCPQKKRPVPKSGTDWFVFSIVLKTGFFYRHPFWPHGGTCFFDSFGATTTGSRPWTAAFLVMKSRDFMGNRMNILGHPWFRSPKQRWGVFKPACLKKIGGMVTYTPTYIQKLWIVDIYCL